MQPPEFVPNPSRTGVGREEIEEKDAKEEKKALRRQQTADVVRKRLLEAEADIKTKINEYESPQGQPQERNTGPG